MRAVLAVALLAASAGALAQTLACDPRAPRTDPGTGFVVSGRTEHILARGGRAGPRWEWAVGNVHGDLDWTSGVALQWTVTYTRPGIAKLEVRNQGAVVLSLSKSSGMQTGNAIHLQVSTDASVGADTTITASAATINDHAVAATISQTGNNQDSTTDLYFYYPELRKGFTASGTVMLTYARLPKGSRVDFQLRAGDVPCNNQAPTVSVSAPAEGSVHQAGSPISFAADAQDVDGTVAQVDFLADGKVIGRDTSAPFSFEWMNAPPGNHTITARAIDNAGDRTRSTAVNFTVNAQPSASIGSPTSGSVLQAPANITLEATAADPDGTVTKVDFYQGGVLVGTDMTSPYSLSLENLLPGPYSFTAVASDDRGGTGTSSAVTVLVNARPTAVLKSPAQNSVFTAPASIAVAAEAGDADGTIARVEFYNGATLITTLATAPYSFTWTDVPQGSYSLTAKVTDNNGGIVTSDAVNIMVNIGVAKLHFVHVDHLNTPRLIADDSQQTVWRWEQQEPFGVNLPENPAGLGAFDLPLRLPGQYFDKETNLHYNYFRDYDPSLGRYFESDPIGLRSGLNTYAYALQNPLVSIDPDGLEVRFICRPLDGANARTLGQRLLGTVPEHCFVHVSCPEEGWFRTLSLFAVPNPAPYALSPMPYFGRKSQNAGPGGRDDPASPQNTVNVTIAPSMPSNPACPCNFEKDVMARFMSFPATPVPYFLLGPNSNTFAAWLVTSPTLGAQLPPGTAPNAPGIGSTWPGITTR